VVRGKPNTKSHWGLISTPYNITELQQQTELVKQYRKQFTYSLPSLADQVLNQLLKGCQIAIYSTVLLASQNEKLTAENYCQKRKRVQMYIYIAKEGILTKAEAQVLIEKDENSCIEAVQGRQDKVQQYILPRYSLYKLLEYKALLYSRYQYIN
jgi:hypothetical protein